MMMLPQEKMIARLRRICRQDSRLVAAMLYGSFTHSEADAFSDIDCILYFQEASLPEIDPVTWLNQIAPVELYYENEFGNGVTIFENLVRGEFHFDPAGDMPKLIDYQGTVTFPSLESTILVDKTGQLAHHLQPLIGPLPQRDTPKEIRFLGHSFINWILFGSNVLARGEYARALEILHIVQDYLLRLVRLQEGQTAHWITPTRNVEQEISAAAYRRFVTCTAGLDPQALWGAYMAAWRWGNELLPLLARRHDLALPEVLIARLDRHLGNAQRDSHSAECGMGSKAQG